MNRNVRTCEFKEMLAGLPEQIQELARAAYEQFVQDPAHPSLRHHALVATKRGRHKAGSFSVSVTMKYRAIYFVDGDTNVWYWIGTHNAYDAFIGSN